MASIKENHKHTIIPTVAITGAGGFVAKNLRKHLSDLKLYSFSRKALRPLAHEKIIRTDYSSHTKLASKLQDCDVLVHLIGIGGDDMSCTVNVDLTSIVTRAAELAGIKHVIFLSGLGVSPSNPSPYFISKLRAERIICTSRIDHTIFRPSFIIGADDYLTKLLNKQARTGTIIIPGTGRYTLQPISIHDTVRIIRDSFLNKRFLNKTLDLVGPQMITFESFVRLCAKSARISRVPLEDCLSRAFAGKGAVYSLGDLNLFYGGYLGDYAKLQKAYGAPIKAAKDFV